MIMSDYVAHFIVKLLCWLNCIIDCIYIDDVTGIVLLWLMCRTNNHIGVVAAQVVIPQRLDELETDV